MIPSPLSVITRSAMTKILVIEDEELIRDTLVQLLETHNFLVSATGNGRIGVRSALSEAPDLILCDIDMPEMDGFEVLQLLRQSTSTAAIPFIFLTAQSSKADFRRGMELGADDYLTKPFTQDELLGAIASQLSKRETITQPLTQALHQTHKRIDGLVNNVASNDATSTEQLALAASLRCALTQNEFLVYYQPQMDAITGKIMGAEALVRWQNSQGELIPPASFIPLAEETGLIVPLGEQVLIAACAQAAHWKACGFDEFRVSVNLSPRQLSEPQLVSRVVEILEMTGLQPIHLELEVTESAVMENAKAAAVKLNELKTLGINIALDDFGTGYASLEYLKQFPFDTLKIDKSFVHNVNSDAQNKAITAAVVQLAHTLNLKVVAEGVETEAELEFLRQHRCDLLQGYLLGRPQPAREFEKLLMASKGSVVVKQQVVKTSYAVGSEAFLGKKKLKAAAYQELAQCEKV